MPEKMVQPSKNNADIKDALLHAITILPTIRDIPINGKDVSKSRTIISKKSKKLNVVSEKIKEKKNKKNKRIIASNSGKKIEVKSIQLMLISAEIKSSK